MKFRLVFFLFTTVIGAAGGWAAERTSFFDLKTQKELDREQALDRLNQGRIVLVGEHHTNADHHRAQLAVVDLLRRSDRPVAIGLEMFLKRNQEILDQWVAGLIPEQRFKAEYLRNWNYDWDLYRPIFMYAREHKVPLVGLNVDRRITNQVAYHGFDSLNEEQRGALEGITCDVSQDYRDFVQSAYGAHAHDGMDFENFCEAQLVWDSAMAVHALDYLKHHPHTTMVILAGSGHARKMGIPAQLAKRAAPPWIVVMPHTPGIFDERTTGPADADLLIRPSGLK